MITPKPEECDGKDNDCDGKTDEDLKRSCYGGVAGTEGKGICKAGEQVCAGGVWGSCVGEVVGSAEKCDKVDNNCDGQVDEGCSCQPNDKQPCGASDVGECQKGQQICDANGKWGACAGEVGVKVETCNNKDDDCDGKIDEELKLACYGGAAGTEGKGVCKAGEKTCALGKWGGCVGEVVPVVEKCDGLDNDCDGQIDESDPILDRGCTSTGLGYCKPGLWKCVNKKMACSIVRTPQKEVCNGVDDNCDGIVDNAGCFVWASSAGGSLGDYGNSITIDNNGSIYVLGSFGGTAGFGTSRLTSKGGQDIFVTKLDKFGKFLWTIPIGGSLQDFGQSIAVDKNGNVFLTGGFWGTADFGSFKLTSKGDSDLFVAKLNSSGKFLWAVSAGGSSYAGGMSIAVNNNGNTYVLGLFVGTASFGTSKLTSSKMSSDIFVTKLDSSGTFLWAVAGGSTSDEQLGITVGKNGNPIITGMFQGTRTFGSFTVTSRGRRDAFVAKLDSSGKFLWAVSAGGSSDDAGRSVTVDSNGNISLTGSFWGTADFGSFKLTSKGEGDVFVAKLDSSGKFLWAVSVGGSLNERVGSLAGDGNGNLYVVGEFQGTVAFGGFKLTSKGNNDVFVAKLDSLGKFLWAVSAGGASDDAGQSVAVDSNGNVSLTGSFWGTADFGSFKLTSKGEDDVFVAKYVP